MHSMQKLHQLKLWTKRLCIQTKNQNLKMNQMSVVHTYGY